MESARPLALITGASSGIGRALAERFARAGYDLILVARRQPLLEALAAELKEQGARSYVMALDCAQPTAAQSLIDQLAAQKLEIDVLINNAGFAQRGLFCQNKAQMDFAMVQLNVAFLTELTRLIVPQMLQRNSGKILNVASTAAFLPGPGMAVYYATKAYVLSFSEALWVELRGTGVHVGVLCPGATESEFSRRSGMEGTFIFKRPMSAETVAAAAYRGLKHNRRVIIPGLMNKFVVLMIRLTPKRVLLKFVRLFNEV